MLKRIILSVVACTTLSHASIFSIEVTNTTTGASFKENYSTVTNTFNTLDTEFLKGKMVYNNTDAINAVIDFRGLPMTLSYATNSSDLVLNIPSIGIIETFTGTSRNGSVDVLSEWLKKDGAATVEKIMNKLAEVSPVDPVAGNPNSMMGQSVATDFGVGFTSVATKQDSLNTVSNIKSENAIMIAPTYSSLDIDDKNSESYMLPLAYSFSFDRNENEKIILFIPISYTQVEGAQSGSISVGLAYSKPINKNWVLTPSISYGGSGSVDLGALAQVASVSLTSSYTWHLPSDFTLSMGNMIGYYATVKLYNGYDPGIENIAYRNALMLNMPTNAIINNTSLEVFAIDTRYTGSALYMNEYQEYGLSYGYDVINLNILSDNEKYSVRNRLKIGFSYLSSKKADGFKVNFGFVF